MEKTYVSLVVVERQSRAVRPDHLHLHTLVLPSLKHLNPMGEEWTAQKLFYILWLHCTVSAQFSNSASVFLSLSHSLSIKQKLKLFNFFKISFYFFTSDLSLKV